MTARPLSLPRRGASTANHRRRGATVRGPLMPALKIRRINCTDPKSARQLADLRKSISAQGEVVSAKSRDLTRKVFGEPLPPFKAVERICQAVQTKGLPAVVHYTEQFDRVKLPKDGIRVTDQELRAAYTAADPDFLDTVRNIRQNVLSFQMGLLHTDAVLSVTGR